MTTREPRGWWEWAAALRELAPSDGAWATGAAWAEACWTWRRGLSEAETLRTAPRLTLEELRTAYRPHVAERTLRLHFRQLLAAGLLEVVRTRARGRPNTYAPRVPVAWRRTDDRQPVAAHRDHDRQRVAGHDGSMTGNVLSEDRQRVAAALSSPETVQSPPSRTRDHAHTRVRAEVRGGLTPDEQRAAQAALERIAAVLPADRSADIDPSWRRYSEVLESVHVLLASGWTPGHLADAVARSGKWDGVGHTTSALGGRLQRLRGKPVPGVRPPRRPTHCGNCDYDRRILFDAAGNPDPAQPCPDCHPDVVTVGGVAP